MGVHESHCCIEHGCKYGHADCPVATGKTKQEGPCEMCGLESSDYFDESEYSNNPDDQEYQHEFEAPDEFKSLLIQSEIHVGNVYSFLLKKAKNSEGTTRERAIQAVGKIELILTALSNIKKSGF